MIRYRSSGILAHITSLSSPYGIGDLGPSSYRFIDFLVESDQTYWQFLPTEPTSRQFDNSPYMCTSAFAGSFLLLSPDLLFQRSLISRSMLEDHPKFSPYTTDYNAVHLYKKGMLQEAFSRFDPDQYAEYSSFIASNPWLKDYALFMTAKNLANQSDWSTWPHEIATRSNESLGKFAKDQAEQINFFCFEQFEFHRQWQLLKAYAGGKGILLFGDLSIYVSYDSADVWANQDIFTIDPKTLCPTHVSGVPPDYFSATGQRWGNPLYNWESNDLNIQEQLITWWSNRLAHLFTKVDMARIDHFRAFESYWSIDAKYTNAVNGEWRKGPGRIFFDLIAEKLGPLNIIAEDLGIISPEVTALRDELGFWGMKVLQFAFDGNPGNSFLPHNFISPHCVVYTGTHDNDTTVGWFLSDKLHDNQREEIRRMANKNAHESSGIHQDLIYLAQASTGMLCIFPLQDILGFGNDCRMNTPGVASGNWRWRCAPECITPEITQQLRDSTRRFNRGQRITNTQPI